MTTEERLADLQACCLAVVHYLDTLVAKGVDRELLMPIRVMLLCPPQPLTETDIRRGQELYRLTQGADGEPRQITMSEQVTAYLQGMRDAQDGDAR